MSILYAGLSDYITARAKDFGYSASALSEKLGFGRSYISGVIHGQFTPSQERCWKTPRQNHPRLSPILVESACTSVAFLRFLDMVLSEQAINATSRFPETSQLNRDFRCHLGTEIIEGLSQKATG